MNSSRPYLECSLPSPDCFIPPNGAISLVMPTSLTPIIPYSNASAVFHVLARSCMHKHNDININTSYNHSLCMQQWYNSMAPFDLTKMTCLVESSGTWPLRIMSALAPTHAEIRKLCQPLLKQSGVCTCINGGCSSCKWHDDAASPLYRSTMQVHRWCRLLVLWLLHHA